MTNALSSKPEKHQRIESLDILRGIALFGVLTVNLITAFRVSIFAQFLPADASAGLLDAIVAGGVRHILELKAFALFSFLFGVGLGVQYQQLSQKGRTLYWLTRRMVVLLGLGLLHLLLLWNGDILVEYAIVGLSIIPLLRAPLWVLAVTSTLMFAVYLLFSIVGLPVPWPEANWIQQHIVAANHVYATGSYNEILKFSIGEIPYLIPLHAAIMPRTLALFLLGVLAWRSGILRNIAEHKHLIMTVAGIGMGGGAALAIADATNVIDSLFSLGQLRLAVQNSATILLAIGFAATVIVVAEFPAMKRILSFFAPAGRMAFTCYIMQSVVFALVFFGYGLGQFGLHGPAEAFAFGVFFFLVQCMLSSWWLQRYRFGPLEWLWRTLMYGHSQPTARLEGQDEIMKRRPTKA